MGVNYFDSLDRSTIGEAGAFKAWRSSRPSSVRKCVTHKMAALFGENDGKTRVIKPFEWEHVGNIKNHQIVG